MLVSTLLACALTMTLVAIGQAGAVADEPDTEATGDPGTALFLVTLTGPGSSADRDGVTAGGTFVPITTATRWAADHYPVVADVTLPGSEVGVGKPTASGQAGH